MSKIKKKYKNESWLKCQYVTKGKSIKDIAQSCGVETPTLYHWFAKFDMEPRDKYSIFEGYIERVCETCGDTFQVRRASTNGSRAKYCSHKCHSKGLEREKVEVMCNNCGEVFKVIPSKAGRKYCSKECAQEDMHGIYDGRYKRYSSRCRNASGDWQINKHKALERDQHMCQFCGETENLQVHHIKAVRNNGTNYIGNLITLCPKCHGQVENT